MSPISVFWQHFNYFAHLLCLCFHTCYVEGLVLLYSLCSSHRNSLCLITLVHLRDWWFRQKEVDKGKLEYYYMKMLHHNVARPYVKWFACVMAVFAVSLQWADCRETSCHAAFACLNVRTLLIHLQRGPLILLLLSPIQKFTCFLIFFFHI